METSYSVVGRSPFLQMISFFVSLFLFSLSRGKIVQSFHRIYILFLFVCLFFLFCFRFPPLFCSSFLREEMRGNSLQKIGEKINEKKRRNWTATIRFPWRSPILCHPPPPPTAFFVVTLWGHFLKTKKSQIFCVCILSKVVIVIEPGFQESKTQFRSGKRNPRKTSRYEGFSRRECTKWAAGLANDGFWVEGAQNGWTPRFNFFLRFSFPF